MKTILFALLLSTSLCAEVLKKDPDGNYLLTKSSFKASELLNDYARLENLNLVVSYLEEETFTLHGPRKIMKDKIHDYVSSVMGRSRNSMLRVPGSPQIQVIGARDVRYAALPMYTNVSKVPDTDDFIQFNYTLKHIEAAEMSRNMRPFLSRYGRVIDMKSANSLHLTDTGRNVRQMVKIITSLDTEETAKSQKEIDEINERHKKVLTKQKSFADVFVEHNGLFVAAFLLIGTIIGFGARGYMMKKIEGGW